MHDREELGVGELRAVVEAFRDGLQAHRHAINRLNVYPVPDGDTGTNMALTVDSVLVEIGAVEPPGTMAEVCSAMSHGALLGARGNSGVILSQVLRGIAETFSPHDSIDGRCLAAALTVAADAAYSAVMKPVEGTILTVLRAAANGAAACDASEPAEAGVGLAGGPSVATVASAARDAGRDALRRTPEMLPVLAQAGVVDAGGTGLLLLLDAVLHVAAGEAMPPPPDLATIGGPGLVADSELHAHGGEGVGDLRYEVMYLLEANDGAIPAFKDVWAGLGDSIVVVGGGGLWNCHIHTDDVGGAVEAGIDVGRPRRIRVTDLAEQVEEERWVREASQPLDRGADPVAPVATAVVAVAAAPGIGRIFHSLGVQRLVPGGPTMNPSTAELLAAVEEAPSGDVIILPNDPNIVAVARQVDGETAKHVTVVATTSVTEALAALLGYDPQANGDDNAEAMESLASGVLTGEVTRAIRASGSGAGPVEAGDWIGLDRSGVRVVAASAGDAACGLLDAMVESAHEIITLVEGEGATAASTRQVSEWLKANRPRVELEILRGGQPHYPYLFGIE